MDNSNDSGLPANKRTAKKNGSKYYYTGKLCKNGHDDFRYVSGNCVSCAEIAANAWVRRNPERVAARKAAWYQRTKSK